MEIVSFVFGILVMCSLIIVIGCVIGIIKMVRHGQKLVELDKKIYDTINQLNSMHQEAINYCEERADDIIRDVDELRSYVDSRIDKALSK